MWWYSTIAPLKLRHYHGTVQMYDDTIIIIFIIIIIIINEY